MLNQNIKEKLNEVFMVSHHKHHTIAPMEGLRGFAAFMVFVVHFAAQSQAWVDSSSFTAALIFYLRFLGATGVDLFFVLSGFLIYGMLIKKSVPYFSYAYRRVKRIYPTFFAVMAIYIALSFIFTSESKIPNGFNEGVIYIVQCLLLLPGIFNIEPIMSVAWTLSYEMFFYIAIPVVIIIFNMQKWAPKKRILFLASIAIVLYIYNLTTFFYIEMLMFIAGMILYEIYSKGVSFNWNKSYIVFPLTFLLMVFFRYLFEHEYEKVVIVVMFFGYSLVCLDVFRGVSFLGKLFENDVMRWYGNMSYSYYLIHGLTLKFLFLILSFVLPANHEDTWVFYTLFLPFFIITLIVSCLLFIAVEKPLSLVKKS